MKALNQIYRNNCTFFLLSDRLYGVAGQKIELHNRPVRQEVRNIFAQVSHLNMRGVPLCQSSITEGKGTSTVEREKTDFFAVINSYKMFAMGEQIRSLFN